MPNKELKELIERLVKLTQEGRIAWTDTLASSGDQPRLWRTTTGELNPYSFTLYKQERKLMVLSPRTHWDEKVIAEGDDIEPLLSALSTMFDTRQMKQDEMIQDALEALRKLK